MVTWVVAIDPPGVRFPLNATSTISFFFATHLGTIGCGACKHPSRSVLLGLTYPVRTVGADAHGANATLVIQYYVKFVDGADTSGPRAVVTTGKAYY